MDAYQVLLKPIVSERSTRLKELNKYVFVVDPRANKTDVKQAVETAFKVHVEAVNMLIRLGKLRRLRTRLGGYKSDTKRAVVTLRAGEKIEFFEGV